MPLIINMRRDHDIEMLNNIKQYNMKTPEFIFCNNRNDYYREMKSNINYMLKPFRTARSVGQVLVTKESIIQMMIDAQNMLFDTFNKKYDIDESTCRNDGERATTLNSIKSCDFYLSEELKFDIEFRVLYMRDVPIDEWIVCKRTGYKANTEEPRHSELVTNSKDFNHDHHILDKIYDLGQNHPSPMLSFDIAFYKGNPYIFEYSSEFGTEKTGKKSEIERQVNIALGGEIQRLVRKK